MVHKFSFLLVCGLISLGTSAAGIFKWVDEKGQVHYSESVPEKYKRSATKIEREDTEPTEAQRQEAAARAAKDKENAESMATRKAKSERPRTDSPPLPKTAGVDDKASRCEAEKRKYRQSEACFAPYRTANGGIKDEAFQHCVAAREPEC